MCGGTLLRGATTRCFEEVITRCRMPMLMVVC
nr:MAG TPA: hypothetical protein [Caudoviricetes sp.]